MEHFSTKQAHEFLRATPSAVFIDCRSEMEYLFVGHPVGSTHVAWNDGPDWEINPHFVADVRRLAGFAGDRPALLICRSGSRSTAAGEALEAVDFTRVYNVLNGFEGDLYAGHRRNTLNGWRFEGLTWEQC
ncbi:MAG: rhodanese-like domain-containing protein [Candidatus Protistobacter heckmanni]|nr:rhodanese-like domain-containing protein [Candidatus Protistobacter heckmanni]